MPHDTAIEHVMPFLNLACKKKKRMYKKAVEDRRGTFTQFVLSVDGLLHKYLLFSARLVQDSVKELLCILH